MGGKGKRKKLANRTQGYEDELNNQKKRLKIKVDKEVQEMTKSFQIISDLIPNLNLNLQESLSLKSATCFFELVFSWRKLRPDIIDIPHRQKRDDCWTYAFSRGQSSLVKLYGSSRRLLTREALVEGVDPKYINRDDGSFQDLHHLIKFLKESSYVEDIIIHRRYKTDHPNYEDFEKLLEKLLGKGPVIVSIDVLPSYEEEFEGKGVYCPTDTDCQVRRFEKFSQHNMLATGHGVEIRGGPLVEFLELQDSQGGKKWGDQGFIRIARHKGLIKEIIELKV